MPEKNIRAVDYFVPTDQQINPHVFEYAFTNTRSRLQTHARARICKLVHTKRVALHAHDLQNMLHAHTHHYAIADTVLQMHGRMRAYWHSLHVPCLLAETWSPILRTSERVCATGKSTYCNAMYDHGQATKRNFHIVNMDPAAEYFKYPVSIGTPSRYESCMYIVSAVPFANRCCGCGCAVPLTVMVFLFWLQKNNDLSGTFH